jgi:hypothetical protein
LYTLFAFVRAENIEDAIKLCRDAHQPWCAVSIRRSLLFLCPAICEFPFLTIAVYCCDLKLDYATLSIGHSTAIQCCRRWRGGRSGSLVREQTAHIMEDSLHMRCPRFPPVVRRTHFIRRTRAVRSDLNHPQVLLSHMGRHTLGDDSVLYEERQSEALVQLGGGFWGPSGREVGGKRCG